MRRIFRRSVVVIVILTFAFGTGLIGRTCRGQSNDSPRPDEQQLPYAMHSAMQQLPHISVGVRDADLIGDDHRALQAAVDYIAGLGGGTVDIRPGTYTMRDSLHLRSDVTVCGVKGQTILKKAAAAVCQLALDGDFGEQQITLADPTGFAVGDGVAIWDDHAGGFHTTVARITGRNGKTFAISKPLMADCMVANHAQTATVFPVVSGYDLRGVRVEDLVIDGSKDKNVQLNGCRGGGIFLYGCHGTVIHGCTVRNYNGDGISFQQSNDVTLVDCRSEDNTMLGLHPGSGSQRPTVRNCVANGNGTDGLFLCWRVRHGVFSDNVLHDNGRYGISIGHKDSDNLLCRNRVTGNGNEGVYFRKETLGMAPHRNKLVANIIENNGTSTPSPGIRIRGEVSGLELRNNTIRDTRAPGQRTQTSGIQIDETVGPVTLDGNTITGKPAIEDSRPDQAKHDQ